MANHENQEMCKHDQNCREKQLSKTYVPDVVVVTKEGDQRLPQSQKQNQNNGGGHQKQPPASPLARDDIPGMPIQMTSPEWDLHAFNQHTIRALIQHSETSRTARRNQWSGLVTF